ncbi:MAG: hypothetical protein HY052_00055 [Proteobacteria bacterium]|nr:hypothetical protein [Pseudomonadota bacterium]
MSERQNLSMLDLLSTVSKSDLKGLGLGDVAYIRRHAMNGHRIFVLHAADGGALAMQNNEDSLRHDASFQELDLVTVH